jgi:sugar phosphate isomerase/epimerase
LNWEQEFQLARECGLDCIELLFESIYNPFNPLYSKDGLEKLKGISEYTGVQIRSICFDYFMQKPFWNNDLNAKNESIQVFKNILFTCRTLSVNYIVLPFFEKGELKTENDMQEMSETLFELAPLAEQQGVNLALEITLPAQQLKPLIDNIKKDCANVGVCFDTGNTTGKCHNVPADILELNHLINHVHIKDRRKSDYQNVLLGEGDANFNAIFDAFKTIGYEGCYILETARGVNPLETAIAHRTVLLNHLRRGAV